MNPKLTSGILFKYDPPTNLNTFILTTPRYTNEALAAAAAASAPFVCLHRMHSGKVLSVGHLCFGRAQSSTRNHCSCTRKIKENTLKV